LVHEQKLLGGFKTVRATVWEATKVRNEIGGKGENRGDEVVVHLSVRSKKGDIHSVRRKRRNKLPWSSRRKRKR